MSDWLDSVAADIITLEQHIRVRLRAITYGKLPDTPIQLGAYGARTILRCIMPARYANSQNRIRKPHGRMVAALGVFATHVVALNAGRPGP